MAARQHQILGHGRLAVALRLLTIHIQAAICHPSNGTKTTETNASNAETSCPAEAMQGGCIAAPVVGLHHLRIVLAPVAPAGQNAPPHRKAAAVKPTRKGSPNKLTGGEKKAEIGELA